MKVLVTTPSFPPAADGVAEAAWRQATGLARRGHAVTVATGKVPGRSSRAEVDRLAVFEFDVSGSAFPTRGYQGETDAYERFVAGFDGDVVVCHCWQTWSTELAMAALEPGGPRRVLVSHGLSTNTWTGPSSWARWILWRPYVWWTVPRIMKSLDLLVLLSRRNDGDRFFDARLAARVGSLRTAVVPNGADLAAHARASDGFRARYDLGDALVLLSVGKFDETKNEKALARAVASAALPDAALVLVGPRRNAYSAAVEAFWRADGRGKLLVLEDLSRNEILEAYRAADVYVSASRTECFPLAILDAMASETPFVSTDVGCVGDLPGGCVVRSADEIGPAVRRLASDAELRASLGRHGRAACEEKFSWERVVDEQERLLTRVVTST